MSRNSSPTSNQLSKPATRGNAEHLHSVDPVMDSTEQHTADPIDSRASPLSHSTDSKKRSAEQAFGSQSQGRAEGSEKVTRVSDDAVMERGFDSNVDAAERVDEWVQSIGNQGIEEGEPRENHDVVPASSDKHEGADHCADSMESVGVTVEDVQESIGKATINDQAPNNDDTGNNEVSTSYQNPQSQQQNAEPTAFDAAIASHALTALSILAKYRNPQFSSPLTQSFENISNSISGATMTTPRITKAEFMGAIDEAQGQLEDLGTRKNASIAEMLAEEQELASIGLVEESAMLMAAVTNAHRFLSVMRYDYEQLDLIKHAVRALDEEEEDDEGIVDLEQL